MEAQTLQEHNTVYSLHHSQVEKEQNIKLSKQIRQNSLKLNKLIDDTFNEKKYLSKQFIQLMLSKGISKIQYQQKVFLQSFDKIKIVPNKCYHPFILTYFVFMLGFKIKVTVKFVEFQNFCNNPLEFFLNEDSSGKYINTGSKQLNKYQYIKIVQFKNTLMKYFTLRQIVKEVAITKLFDLLDIGPQYCSIGQFDILAYTNAACYKMQRWLSIKCVIPKINPQEKIKQLKQNLQNELKILRNLKMIHKSIKPQNIFYSMKKDKFILLDLSMVDLLNNQQHQTKKETHTTHCQDIEQYNKTDQKLLEELINTITLKYKTKNLKYIGIKHFYNYVFTEETKMIKNNFKHYYVLILRQSFELFKAFYGYGCQIYPIINQYSIQNININYAKDLKKMEEYLDQFPKDKLTFYSQELDNLETILFQNSIFYPTLKLQEQKWMFNQIASQPNILESKKQLFQCFKYLGCFTLKIQQQDNMCGMFFKKIRQTFQQILVIEFLDIFVDFSNIFPSRFINKQENLLKRYQQYVLQKHLNQKQIVFFSQIIVIYLSCKRQSKTIQTNLKNFETFSEFVYQCFQVHRKLLKQKGLQKTEEQISFYVNFIKFSSSFNTISISYLEKLIDQSISLLLYLATKNEDFSSSIYYLNILMFQTTCVSYKYSTQQLQFMNGKASQISQIYFDKPNRVQIQVNLNLSEIFYSRNQTDKAEQHRKTAYELLINLMNHFEILQTLQDDELNLNPQLKKFFLLLKKMQHKEALEIVLKLDTISRFELKEQEANKAKSQILYINNAFGIKKPNIIAPTKV